MGGAEPVAVTMTGGVALVVEVDRERIERRLATRYLDRATDDVDQALAWTAEARAAGRPLSIGLVGNAAETHGELRRRGLAPDVVTDQTSAHDPPGGRVPAGLGLPAAADLRPGPAQED